MINKKKIEAEAKEILNKFSKKLEKIKDFKEEGLILRKESLRTEEEGIICEKDFKKRILKNAKNKNKDFIIAKEKSW